MWSRRQYRSRQWRFHPACIACSEGCNSANDMYVSQHLLTVGSFPENYRGHQLTVRKGIRLTCRNFAGFTPIHHAYKFNSTPFIVEKLMRTLNVRFTRIECGANVDIPACFMSYPIFSALSTPLSADFAESKLITKGRELTEPFWCVVKFA